MRSSDVISLLMSTGSSGGTETPGAASTAPATSDAGRAASEDLDGSVAAPVALSPAAWLSVAALEGSGAVSGLTAAASANEPSPPPPLLCRAFQAARASAMEMPLPPPPPVGLAEPCTGWTLSVLPGGAAPPPSESAVLPGSAAAADCLASAMAAASVTAVAALVAAEAALVPRGAVYGRCIPFRKLIAIHCRHWH